MGEDTQVYMQADSVPSRVLRAITSLFSGRRRGWLNVAIQSLQRMVMESLPFETLLRLMFALHGFGSSFLCASLAGPNLFLLSSTVA